MKTLKTILCRDKVVSVVNGKDLVGLYLKSNSKNLLLECDPKQADKIIALWNKTQTEQSFNAIVKFFIMVCNGIRSEYEQGASRRDLNRDIKALKNLLTKI
jgi:hypothetical protein